MRFLLDKISQVLKTTQEELEELKREKCERLNLPYDDPALKIPQLNSIGQMDDETDELLVNQLSRHILSPLIMNYEEQIAYLRRELTKSRNLFKQQLGDLGRQSDTIVAENIQLREDLEVSKREYLKLIDETKNRGNEGEEGGSNEETMELKNRAHILSEEN